MTFLQTIIVNEYEAGLFYDDGRFVRALPAGRYRFFNGLGQTRRVVSVDLRQTTVSINGQEMLTADKVALRLNLAASYRVVDAALAVNSVQNYVLALYTELQLALRGIVTAMELDALMADRDALAVDLLARAQPVAAGFGVRLESVGVRDVILPGEVKKMLAREAEALREGRAALVAAREETAATRAALNTARMLADNPVLMQLKALQSLETVAAAPSNTMVLTLPNVLTELLSPRSGAGSEE
jgi:regulator of protease activity HflC (stomatin/prohibitin superfamily)